MKLHTLFKYIPLSLILLLCANVNANVLDRIVAVVEDDVIMQSELEQRVNVLVQQFNKQRTEIPPEDVLTEQVLQRLIVERLQLQRAERRGIQIDDLTLDQAMRNLAKRNQMDLEQFRDALVKQQIDYSTFREQIRNEITLEQLRRRVVERRIEVDDSEIDEMMHSEGAKDNLIKKEYEYKISHILISLSENPKPKEIEKAQRRGTLVYQRAIEGSNFAKLAIAASDAQDALKGGDLGWRGVLQIPEVFVQQLGQMQPGEISKISQSPAGYHIFKLEDRREITNMMVTQVLARHILIKTNAIVTDEDAERRLSELRTRIKLGDDFADLAKAHSEDTGSAVQGGELGWSVSSSYVQKFQEMVDSLDTNEISEPFKSRYGWHIVEVMDKRKHDSTEDAMRQAAIAQIRQRKLEEETELWIREIRDQSYIENRLHTAN